MTQLALPHLNDPSAGAPLPPRPIFRPVDPAMGGGPPSPTCRYAWFLEGREISPLQAADAIDLRYKAMALRQAEAGRVRR